jgi:NADH:ubiquinone oxidoreductase subunit B-like Fe-S oxidoreductase
MKRRIKSTEDFIRYAATQSSLSGQPYQVSCGGIEMPTAEWLMEALVRFREKKRRVAYPQRIAEGLP